MPSLRILLRSGRNGERLVHRVPAHEYTGFYKTDHLLDDLALDLRVWERAGDRIIGMQFGED